MSDAGTSTSELTREEIARYSRHLIMPEVTMEGQRKLKAGSVLLVGAGGLGSPGRAVPGRGRRRAPRHPGLRRGGREQPAAAGAARHELDRQAQARERASAAQRAQPAREGRDARDGAERGQRAPDPGGLRRRRRRHRQLRDALPDERRLLPAQEAERLRLDLPLRGPGERLLARPRPVLPLPVSRAASAGPRAELRRGRRARDPAGRRRRDPGHGGAQDPARDRRAARGAAAALRRARR